MKEGRQTLHYKENPDGQNWVREENKDTRADISLLEINKQMNDLLDKTIMWILRQTQNMAEPQNCQHKGMPTMALILLYINCMKIQ